MTSPMASSMPVTSLGEENMTRPMTTWATISIAVMASQARRSALRSVETPKPSRRWEMRPTQPERIRAVQMKSFAAL